MHMYVFIFQIANVSAMQYIYGQIEAYLMVCVCTYDQAGAYLMVCVCTYDLAGAYLMVCVCTYDQAGAYLTLSGTAHLTFYQSLGLGTF